jgi:hypothetical protein
VRRAATLAGFAGALAPTKPADDPEGDPGEGVPVTLSPAGPSPDDAALAARIAPVIGDEGVDDASDESRAESSATATTGERVKLVKWGAWAAFVVIVAVAARSAFRSRP